MPSLRYLCDTFLYDILGTDLVHGFSKEHNLSARLLQQAADGLKQRCLTGAVGTDQRNDFAFLNLHGYILQCMNHAIVDI